MATYQITIIPRSGYMWGLGDAPFITSISAILRSAQHTHDYSYLNGTIRLAEDPRVRRRFNATVWQPHENSSPSQISKGHIIQVILLAF